MADTPGAAFCCQICGCTDPTWMVQRNGDAAVSWACNPHLAAVCTSMQRDYEVTELVVVLLQKAQEWAEIARALDREAGND